MTIRTGNLLVGIANVAFGIYLMIAGVPGVALCCGIVGVYNLAVWKETGP